MNATNVPTNASEAGVGGPNVGTLGGSQWKTVLRRMPGWLGIALVLSGLFGSTSSAVAGVSFWNGLPAALAVVHLNLLFMLPLLYRGIIRHGAKPFRVALTRTAPAVLFSQPVAAFLSAFLIQLVFPHMLLENWWLTFTMLLGTATMVSLLGLPLTLHYEQIRGELFAKHREVLPAHESVNTNSRPSEVEDAPGQSRGKPRPGLWIPGETGKRLVQFQDILYLTSRGHATVIHTDTRDYKMAVLMKRLGENLPMDGFMRVHKSHMINLKRVQQVRYFMGGAYTAYLNDDAETEVPVGRTYAAALKQVLGIAQPPPPVGSNGNKKS